MEPVTPDPLAYEVVLDILSAKLGTLLMRIGHVFSLRQGSST